MNIQELKSLIKEIENLLSHRPHGSSDPAMHHRLNTLRALLRKRQQRVMR